MNCIREATREFSLKRKGSDPLVVHVLGFDFQLFLARLAHPMVFAVDERVVVNALALVFRAEVTLHTWSFYRGRRRLRLEFKGRRAEYHEIDATVRGAPFGCFVRSQRPVFAVADGGQPLGRDVLAGNQILK